MRVLLLLTVIVLLASPAHASFRSNWLSCGNARGADAIKACTWLLKSGRLKGKQRPAVWFNRGWLHHDLRQYQQAIRDYSRTLTLDPRHSAALTNRGKAYLDIMRFEPAIADYTRALRLNPRDATSFFYRGFANENLGRKAAAVRDYRAALRLAPSQKESRAGLKRLSSAR